GERGEDDGQRPFDGAADHGADDRPEQRRGEPDEDESDDCDNGGAGKEDPGSAPGPEIAEGSAAERELGGSQRKDGHHVEGGAGTAHVAGTIGDSTDDDNRGYEREGDCERPR